jgi:hypothetical protein
MSFSKTRVRGAIPKHTSRRHPGPNFRMVGHPYLGITSHLSVIQTQAREVPPISSVAKLLSLPAESNRPMVCASCF